MRGEREESLYLLDLLLQKFPNYARAYYAKGQIQSSIGEIENAICNIKKSLKIDSKNKSFQKGLKNVEAKLVKI